MKLFMKYCFQELGLHKLKLKVYENNIPAIRLYEKL
ncbi:MAG: GNAT family N-acetyltransferase [Patescibacteria group bacterium]